MLQAAPRLTEMPVPHGGLGPIAVAGIALTADCAGALWWPEENLLVVADLHLEEGSSFARRGMLLPTTTRPKRSHVLRN